MVNITFSRFVYFPASSLSFSFPQIYVYIFVCMNIYEYINSFVYMHHIFGIHPSSSFLNDAAVDVGLQAHVCQDMESLGYLPRSGTPGSYGSSSFNF